MYPSEVSSVNTGMDATQTSFGHHMSRMEKNRLYIFVFLLRHSVDHYLQRNCSKIMNAFIHAVAFIVETETVSLN